MILNAWYDRATGASSTCNTDITATELSYGNLPPLEGDSAAKLLVPTFGEQLHAQRGGRVVAISMKPRSSITLAGRGADIVTWFDDRGAWTTSSVYGKHPAVQKFVDANPIGNLFNAAWDRLRPVETYDGTDDGAGEKTVGGWATTFPHPLAPATGKPDRTFFVRWTSSPFSDEYMGRMAAAVVDELKLGQEARTDLLGISFSALDLVGHAYGPRSHEVQDVIARLDLVIGTLLDKLDATVGKDRYVLGLSADHGVAPVPEQTQGSGRILNA
jgi:predicted AlkP superfamily pyrophosphatase or phosphodiesterase